MRFDLKTPCKNCPFRNGPDRITFRTRERAAEIAEGAYRNGFPCHLSAEYFEDEEGDGDQAGYVFGDNTQHCAGALAMLAQDHMGGPWPGIDNSDRRADLVYAQLEPIFDQVFASEQEFIDANSGE